MTELLLLLVLIGALGAAGLLWRNIQVQRLSRMRLGEPDAVLAPGVVAPDVLPGAATPAGPHYVRDHNLVPWIVGLALGAGLYWGLGWPWVFCITFGLIAGLLGGQVESFRQGWVTILIEQQLSDAIDLMVAALQAGAGTLSAMESALQETQLPLRLQLEEVLGRIRFGDDPQQVLRALEKRVPLEVFRLFVSTLSVHWETGGSLGPTLATVGKVVRDRIEVNRRIRALTHPGPGVGGRGAGTDLLPRPDHVAERSAPHERIPGHEHGPGAGGRGHAAAGRGRGLVVDPEPVEVLRGCSRPLPACPAGEAGRWLEEWERKEFFLCFPLASDLLHLPGKPAGVGKHRKAAWKPS